MAELNLSECKMNKILFIDKLVKTLIDNGFSDSWEEIKSKIERWLENGEESEEINTLLSSPDISKNFPIWWSGFYVEDPVPESNPIKDMRRTATELKGYSSLDTKLSIYALDEQNKMWSSCIDDPEFKFGNFLSITYTKLALRNNPKNIGLFLNKDDSDFLKSYFFQTEIDIIDEHYKVLDMHVNLYILNLKDNCSDIKQIIKEKVKNINVICINNCNPLSSCVKVGEEDKGADRRKSKKKHKNKYKKGPLQNPKKTKTKRKGKNKRKKNKKKTHKKKII